MGEKHSGRKADILCLDSSKTAMEGTGTWPYIPFLLQETNFLYLQADLVHLHPSKDFQCPFLEIAFDSEPAQGSMLAECASLDAFNCVEIAKKWYAVIYFPSTQVYSPTHRKVPYSYLRLQVKPLPDEVKAAVADYAPLDTLL
jgi:hypothetical protein